MCFLKFLNAPVTPTPTLTKDTFSPFTSFTQPLSPQSPINQQSQISLKNESLKSALMNCLKMMNLNSEVLHRLDHVGFSLFRNWKKVISFYIEVMIYFLGITPQEMQK